MRSALLRVVIVLVMWTGGELFADSTGLQMQRMDSGLPNLSDRPIKQDRNIDVFVDALYWHTSETIDWSFTIAPNHNFERTTYKTISFGWDPGFRVGLGYNMHHDQWDTQIAYTWFQTQARDHVKGAVTSAFLAARLSLLEPFKTGKVRFDVHYNMFDWDLGRSFLVSRFLSLRPFIGVKGGWISQKIHMKWTTPNFLGLGTLYFADENVKNNFRGGGPKGGVNGKWILGSVNRHAFSIISNFSAAYMWGRWTLRDEFVDVLLTQTSIPMKARNFGALMFQALMGFGWEFNFDKNRSHFALKLGYEIEDWMSQFQVFSDASGTQNSDLVLQGLTADLRLDF
ncbi:MAG: hypothetical protein HYX48_07660 [Chlamydiales bacterium]|nr:hypothetical protein [Chlamydiales bacterium]